MSYAALPFRRLLLIVILALFPILSFGPISAAADGGSAVPPLTGPAWLTIEVATCPSGFTGDTSADYHAACSDNPAEAVALTLTPGTSGTGTSPLTTDTLGQIDVRLETAAPTYDVTVPALTGIAGFLVFCSGLDGTGSALSYSYTASGFRLNGVQPGDAILCDLFLIPSGTPVATDVVNTDVGAAPVTSSMATAADTSAALIGSSAPSGLVVTQLPNTGAGQSPMTSEGSANRILLLIAFLALLSGMIPLASERLRVAGKLRG
jgi:hypothetical protein